jgi:uncharacterized protein YjbI with pentapeptide repeats
VNEQHVNLSAASAAEWRDWRMRNPDERPDFRGYTSHKRTSFVGKDLSDADFRGCVLRAADFAECDLSSANFRDADVVGANFCRASLDFADLRDANMGKCNLYQASCRGSMFEGSNLFMTNLKEAILGGTVFANVDLGTCIGLDDIVHDGPSSLSVDTLFRSAGGLSRDFLTKIGFPDIMVEFVPSLIQAGGILPFHSCFISYSHRDESFARTLWARMKTEQIAVWYAPEDMQGGKKLFDQIDRAISLHDKLILIVSQESMMSNWVETEIKRARKYEIKTGERKLFPISLVKHEVIKAWELFDADSGRDIAAEIREYFIPDFSNWRDGQAFNEAFQRLRRDLKKEGVRIN